jgi:ligand-binding sensor domain-containing protein
MFGDGLYQFDGTTWTKLPVTLPSDLCEITAITEVAGNLCVGTRRAGRYEITLPYYLTKPAGPEPYNHNCQAIAGFRGEVFMSTLEDGLVVYGGLAGWRRYASPDISSNAPRQLAEFDGKLYVRHGSGKVDRFDGSRWELDVCRSLPRKQTSMIYSDGKRLYAGQWGGWSEFDGRAWSHFLRCPDLQGAQVTSILPEEDKMWVGTQGHGLAEVSRRSLAVKWHDERLGMPDDWIKCTGRLGTETFAGTFVGGLARMCDGKWQVVKEVGPGEVTALTTDTDTLYISTRTGIFRREPSGATTQVFSEAGGEVQALCIIGSEFWIGTRTGIYVAPRDGYRHE